MTNQCVSTNSEGAMDHSLYLERVVRKGALTQPNVKVPCGPVSAGDSAFQTHLVRLEAVRRGLLQPPLAPSVAYHPCCYARVPQIFSYDDCWYITQQAKALGLNRCI